MFGLSKVKFFVLLAIIVVVAASASAFAAENTVGPSTAGEGDADITGYTIDDVEYTFNALDPTMIDAIDFSVTPDEGGAAASYVTAKVKSNWYGCSQVGVTNIWTCDTDATPGPQLMAADAENLDVVASANKHS
jgi:hypothetical protein